MGNMREGVPHLWGTDEGGDGVLISQEGPN